ncbi:MAG: DUF167 family protein [Gammaproteobacteria bacterium]
MEACRWQDAATLVCRLRVQPRAQVNGFAGVIGDRVRLRIQSPPVDGRANDAVRRFLAKAFGVPLARVELLAGENTRDKIVRIISPSKIPHEIASLGAPTGDR